MKDRAHESAIPEHESVALLKDRQSVFSLTGDDEGFGSLAVGKRPPESRKGGGHHHQRHASTETEISWMSNISSFLRRGHSTSVDSADSDRRRRKRRYQRVWGILFDKPEAIFVSFKRLAPFPLINHSSLTRFLHCSPISFLSDKHIFGFVLHVGHSLFHINFCRTICASFSCRQGGLVPQSTNRRTKIHVFPSRNEGPHQ